MRKAITCLVAALGLAGCGGDEERQLAGEVFGRLDSIGERPIDIVVVEGEPVTAHAPADRAVAADRSHVWFARANATIETDGAARRVGRRPAALAYDRRTLWVLDDADNAIRGLDPETLELRRRIDLPSGGDVAPGAGPTDLAARDGALWVTDNTLHTVTRYSEVSGRQMERYETGVEPEAVAVAPDGTVYTADQGAGTVTRIEDGEAEQIDLAGDASPVDVAIDGDRVWVADQHGFVHLLEDGEPVKAPGASAITVADGYVWVVSEEAGTLTRIRPL